MNGKKPTILVVDTIPEQIDQISIPLIDHHDVIVATNGSEALEIAEKNQPDLIFLDVAVADMDIQKMHRHLNSKPSWKNTPLVLLVSTGHSNDDCFSAKTGVTDYIDRSLSPGEIRARIHLHLTYKRKLEELERLVVTDGLTGISNRRHFDETLDREWRRSMREKTGLSLIMLDIDHFKRFNDQYGHARGDDCLKRVAQALKGGIRRPSDFLARIGGEEFALILYHVDCKGTEILAQNLRERVEALRIPHAGSTSADVVTTSIGYATMTPTRGSTPEPLLETADRMLYLSKSSGRNQVRGTVL